MSRPRLPISLTLLALSCLLSHLGRPTKASGLGSMVQAYCLAAVQQEISQAGKVAPEGMAAFACRCVVDRLSEGTSLHSARSYCRESTARRYSL